MELVANNGKTSVREKRPRIKKGYYTGVLTEFKPLQDKDGKDVEGKFGKQAVLLFAVHDKDTMIMVNNQPLHLPKLVYTQYKNSKDGTYNSAITPGSQTTKVLKALGWNYEPNKKLDTKDLIGNSVELNIDDYDAKWLDEKGIETTYKASCIKDINKLDDGSVSEESFDENSDPKILQLKKLFEQGLLTQEGFEKAIKELKK